MRTRLFAPACALLLCLGMRTVRAQEPTLLTLRQAQEIAITNHPRITAAGLVALASKEVVREARSAYYPTVTADATAVGTGGSNTRLAAGGLNNSLILERNAEGVNASQIITDFGRTKNLTASSQSQARAEEQGTLATRAQILLELDTAYFDALAAQSVLTVAKETVATRQLTFDQINELAKNKLKSSLDVSFAKVNLEGANLLVANANNDVQSAFASLANLLGERGQKNYRLMDEPLSPARTNDDSQLVQTALRDRPDLVQLRFQAAAAASFARAEKDLNYPTLSVAGSAGYVPLGDSNIRQSYGAAGVNLSIPIFDGMLFTAKEEEAKLRAKAAAENLRDAEDNVIRDVRIAAMNLTYAAQRMDLTAKLLESANEAFDLAQARYKVGSSSIVELSQAQLNQTSAQIDATRAKYDYQTHDAVLGYEMGELQ
jgi:outer membrane protein